jgi:hypothetical protein
MRRNVYSEQESASAEEENLGRIHSRHQDESHWRGLARTSSQLLTVLLHMHCPRHMDPSHQIAAPMIASSAQCGPPHVYEVTHRYDVQLGCITGASFDAEAQRQRVRKGASHRTRTRRKAHCHDVEGGLVYAQP